MLQTLTDFLAATDARARFYDLGQRLTPLSKKEFHQFELTDIPYPLPWLQQAWLAVLIWNPAQPGRHLIWFLRFPLDEEGRLVQAARDDFLQRLARCVGKDLLDEEGEDPLKDNPFAFKPSQEKMAAFHARATRDLGAPPSAHYAAVRHYLRTTPDGDDWAGLGLQGIADLAARLEEDDNTRLLAASIPRMPDPLLAALATQLEHHHPHHRIARALLARLEQAATGDNPLLAAALVRGLSRIHSDGLRRDAIRLALTGRCGTHAELLAAIASRCQGDLMEPQTLHQFMENLAAGDLGQQGFNRILAELLYQPGMREVVLAALRNPERSETLAARIGGFFQALNRG